MKLYVIGFLGPKLVTMGLLAFVETGRRTMKQSMPRSLRLKMFACYLSYHLSCLGVPKIPTPGDGGVASPYGDVLVLQLKYGWSYVHLQGATFIQR